MPSDVRLLALWVPCSSCRGPHLNDLLQSQTDSVHQQVSPILSSYLVDRPGSPASLSYTVLLSCIGKALRQLLTLSVWLDDQVCSSMLLHIATWFSQRVH